MKKILALMVFALSLVIPSAMAVDYDPVVYPAQQTAVGDAALTIDNGTYTFSNNLFHALFVTTDGKLKFGGCSEMSLKPGTELFTVTFGDGASVKASELPTPTVTSGDLEVKTGAVKGSDHYAGKYLQAVYTYTKGEATLTFTWRAELRDGSHYLRTDLTVKSDHDIQMKSFLPMQYIYDTTTGGDAPEKLGNVTYGNVLMNDKIFAGLETPMGQNSVNDSDGETYSAFPNVSNWTKDLMTWTPSSIPAALQTQNSTSYNASDYLGTQGLVKFSVTGSVTATFQWQSGACGLWVAGVELVNPETGVVVSSDYNLQFTGGGKQQISYTLNNIVANQVYLMRFYYDSKKEGAANRNTSNGNITWAYTSTYSAFPNVSNWTKDLMTWTPSSIPTQLQNQSGVAYTAANYLGTQGLVKFSTSGTVTATFQWQSGACGLWVAGVELVDPDTEEVLSYSYNLQFTGGGKQQISYPLSNVVADKVYLMRFYYDSKKEGAANRNSSNGNITWNPSAPTSYTPTVGNATPTAYTPEASGSTDKYIKGLWSRNTNLYAYAPDTNGQLGKDMEWNVSTVVGFVNPAHKRRSFLAYSERERAVPWRPFPLYNSWYELNINRKDHDDPSQNMTTEQAVGVVNQWKNHMYTPFGEGIQAYVWDDGWDEYGKWTPHSGFTTGFAETNTIATSMNTGIGCWLGPRGGYGHSADLRRKYWTDRGSSHQLSQPDFFSAFMSACREKVENYDFRFFKFDGISTTAVAYGPANEEDCEGIITVERLARKMREDLFFNTTVGTWASPFWFHFADAIWRQSDDHGTIGTGANNREQWITYRDNWVHKIFTDPNPYCPINSMMTHGFILSDHGGSSDRTYSSILNELRCAFACGDAMVELYADYSLLNSINGGSLWGEIAKCIKWQKDNADVLPDIHWVGGDPWDETTNTHNIYGWASWNGQKATFTLRNGDPAEKTITLKLRDALDIPSSFTGQVYLVGAFSDLKGTLKHIAKINGTAVDDNTAINIDADITFTLPGSSVFVYNGGVSAFANEPALNDIETDITYNALDDANTSTWSEWYGEVPTRISDLDSNYTKTNLRVMEKVYEFTEDSNNFTTTFTWTGGSNRLDIVGVEVLGAGDEVVASAYHHGHAGNPSVDNTYTLNNIPAGTYTVRYITTKHYGNESNINTEGKITNVLTVAPKTFDPDKLYTIHEPDGSRGYMAYNPAETTKVGLADVTLNGYQNLHASTTNSETGIAFRIIESPTGTVKFYCEKNSSYVKLANTNNSTAAEWTTNPSEAATFTYTKEGNNYLFQPTGASNYLNPSCGYQASQGPVRLGSKEGTSDWEVKEYIAALQDRHLYTIKGEFSDGSFAPIVNDTYIKAGAADATPETFVFFETTHENNAGLTPVFKLGTVEGNGYFVYNAGGNANTTVRANAADVAFPTSKTTLADGWSFEGNGVKVGYYGMVGLNGTNIYRSYAVMPSTNINFNTRDNKGTIYATNSLNNTSNWCFNYVIEEVKGYDVYDVIVQGSATVAYQGTQGNCLTTMAQSNGGYLVLKSDVTLSEGDFNVSGLATGSTADITIDSTNKTITVKSIDNVSDVITYTPLNTSCWSAWQGDVPAEITAEDVNCTSDNLRVIEKNYEFTEKCALEATFQYTSGSARTDIVGLEVLDGSGNVVAHDYHFGYTGGKKDKNVYTVIVPAAGIYTVRYITTARSTNGANVSTNGTITNAVITPYYRIPGTYYMYIQDGDDYLYNTYAETYTQTDDTYAGDNRNNAYIWRVVSDGTNITLTNGESGTGYIASDGAAEQTTVAIDDVASTWTLTEIAASKIWPAAVLYCDNAKGFIVDGDYRAYDGGFFVTDTSAHSLSNDIVGGDVAGYKHGDVRVDNLGSLTATVRYYTQAEEDEMPYLSQQIYESIGAMTDGAVGYAPLTDEDYEDQEIFELLMTYSFDPELSGGVPAENYRESLATFNKLIESKKDDIIMPQYGHAYKLSVRSTDGHSRWYLTNNGGVSTNEADAAIFVMGSTGTEGYGSLFATNDQTASKYLRNNGATGASYTANKCDFEVETMLKKNNGHITADMAHRFGTFSLKAKERNNNSWAGSLILREGNQSWDNSTEPYMDGTLSSAIEMTEVEYPYTQPNFAYGTAGDAHEGGYATIWLPFPMHFPSGIEVYKGTVENADGTVLKVEQVDAENVTAAGGYILYDPNQGETDGENGKVQQLVLPAAAAPADLHEEGDAVFTGSTDPAVTAMSVPTGYTPYVLSKKNGLVGLYQYTGTTYPKGKAIWLKPTTSNNASVVKFGFDDIISAIDALHGNAQGSEIYDLQGHRLDKAVKGQINVINGKKIMIK